jgi:hypothetical protein
MRSPAGTFLIISAAVIGTIVWAIMMLLLRPFD